MHTTWYLSVEWQMTVFVAPLLIYLLWRFGNNAVKLIEALIVVQSLHAVFIFYKSKIIVQDHDM